MPTNFIDQEQKEFERFYKTSLLWIKLRPILKRVSIGLFLVTDTLLLLFFVWSFLDFGVWDFYTDRAQVGAIVEGSTDLHEISEERAATGITAGEVGVLAHTDDRADFYAIVSNPNTDWYVSFEYAFSYSGGETEAVQGFLLPGEEEKTLVALGVPVEGTVRTAEIVLSNVEWARVNYHAIADYTTWQADRLDFEYEEVGYEREVELVNGTTIARSTFTIVNKGAYAFWEPSFVVVLRRNSNVVGVTSVVIPRLDAGESREIAVNWFGISPSANETEIEPTIDIFDPSVFMPLEGEAMEDVRERVKVRD